MANKNNPFSSYYNYPKAYGEAPPEERWHSDKSEPGMVPPWLSGAFSRKDQFGFGTSRPELDMKEIMKKAGDILDEVYSSGQINQDEFKQLYSTVQKEAMKIDPKVPEASHASIKRDIGNELQDPRLWSNIKGMLTGKSREERIAAHKDLDSSKFKPVWGDENYEFMENPKEKTGFFGKIKKGLHDYADRQSTVDYYDVWSGKWKQAER